MAWLAKLGISTNFWTLLLVVALVLLVLSAIKKLIKLLVLSLVVCIVSIMMFSGINVAQDKLGVYLEKDHIRIVNDNIGDIDVDVDDIKKVVIKDDKITLKTKMGNGSLEANGITKVAVKVVATAYGIEVSEK